MEENNNIIESKKEKGNKGLVIGLIIIIILLIGIIAILIVKPTIFNHTADSNNKNDKNIQETTKKDDKSKTIDTDKETSKDNVIKDLDLSKSLNTNGYTYSNVSSENKEWQGFKLNKTDDGSANVTIDWTKWGKWSTSSAWSEESKTYKVIDLKDKVKDVLLAGFGQSYDYQVLFYLMEDGTVEYTHMYLHNKDSQGNNYLTANFTRLGNDEIGFKSEGTVPGVNNIVKLYSAQVTTSGGTGYATTIAATKDGSFYDLNEVIK